MQNMLHAQTEAMYINIISRCSSHSGGKRNDSQLDVFVVVDRMFVRSCQLVVRALACEGQQEVHSMQ